MSAISGCLGSCGTTDEARSAGCRSMYLKYGSSSAAVRNVGHCGRPSGNAVLVMVGNGVGCWLGDGGLGGVDEPSEGGFQ